MKIRLACPLTHSDVDINVDIGVDVDADQPLQHLLCFVFCLVCPAKGPVFERYVSNEGLRTTHVLGACVWVRSGRSRYRQQGDGHPRYAACLLSSEAVASFRVV